METTRTVLDDKTSGRFLLIFADKSSFGQFCEQLAYERIPFEYTNSLAIVLHQQDFKKLPQSVHSIFKKYDEEGLVIKKPEPKPTGKRRIPTPDQSREVLRGLIPEEFLPTE